MSTAGQCGNVLIAHNPRSIHNVGSLLRSGEVFAVDTVYMTGFTPPHPGDERGAAGIALHTLRQR